jgi:hypothetical protein
MQKKYFFIAGIICLILAVGALYFYNKPHQTAAGLKTDLSIDALDLYNQYQKDEVMANKKFLDKIIEVKGMVTDVQQSSVQLGAGEAMGGINCSLAGNNEGKTPLPSKGARITVKGKCSGMLMDVNLVDCVIQQ